MPNFHSKRISTAILFISMPTIQQPCPSLSLRFVGSSGAGKSGLINVLLGDAPVLPSAGEGSAVTAATVELRYWAQRLVAELAAECLHLILSSQFLQ